MLAKVLNKTRQLPVKQNPELVELGNKYRHVIGETAVLQHLFLNISKITKALIQIY